MKKVIFTKLISHYHEIATQVLPCNFITALPPQLQKSIERRGFRKIPKKLKKARVKYSLILSKEDLKQRVKIYKAKNETKRANSGLNLKTHTLLSKIFKRLGNLAKRLFLSKGELK